MTNEEILQSLNEKITASTEALLYLNQCKSHFKTFTNMKMTDQQLIEQIAEILFKDRELDVWLTCDTLEGLFARERPDLKNKYQNMLRDNELQQKVEQVNELKQQIQQLEKEMQTIRESY